MSDITEKDINEVKSRIKAASEKAAEFKTELAVLESEKKKLVQQLKDDFNIEKAAEIPPYLEKLKDKIENLKKQVLTNLTEAENILEEAKDE